MFAAVGRAMYSTRMTFLSKAGLGAGIAERLRLQSLIGVVRDCRKVTKADMRLNDYQPLIEVDPQTYQVRADGELLTCEPAVSLPLAQRFFLF
jgi:urease subunit alpha